LHLRGLERSKVARGSLRTSSTSASGLQTAVETSASLALASMADILRRSANDSAQGHLPTLEESSHSSRQARPSGQSHRKLGEVADLAIDRDGAAVLVRHNLVTDRQAEPRTLTGRLGCEEGLK
jgi:hypothetical protein